MEFWNLENLVPQKFWTIQYINIGKTKYWHISYKKICQNLYTVCSQQNIYLGKYMLNKNTLGVKKVRGQSEATYKQAGVTKSFDIS